MVGRLSDYLPQTLMLLVAIALFYIIPEQIQVTPGEAVGPSFVPIVVTSLIILMSLSSIVTTFLSNSKAVVAPVKELGTNSEQVIRQKKEGITRVVASAISLFIWAIITPIIGFFITTFLLTLALMYLMGNRNIVKMIIISGVSTVILYMAAEYLLYLSF